MQAGSCSILSRIHTWVGYLASLESGPKVWVSCLLACLQVKWEMTMCMQRHGAGVAASYLLPVKRSSWESFVWSIVYLTASSPYIDGFVDASARHAPRLYCYCSYIHCMHTHANYLQYGVRSTMTVWAWINICIVLRTADVWLHSLGVWEIYNCFEYLLLSVASSQEKVDHGGRSSKRTQRTRWKRRKTASTESFAHLGKAVKLQSNKIFDAHWQCCWSFIN